MNRPTCTGSRVTTPHAATVMRLLGSGIITDSVALTRDEYQALNKLYEFEPETDSLMQAGADRNMMRLAREDGLRLVAWLARFVPKGEDPLKTLIQAALEAGWDVPSDDIAWAEDDDA